MFLIRSFEVQLKNNFVIIFIWLFGLVCVGMFSLRKKIEDSVNRAEMLGLSALEFEEARRVKQEEMVREYDLWDDLAKSSDILIKLADSAKVVDALKDLTYKVMFFSSWTFNFVLTNNKTFWLFHTVDSEMKFRLMW